MEKGLKIPKRFPMELMDRVVDNTHQFSELMIQLELEFTDQLDADRLTRAADLALDAEPVLGCRFVHHWHKPYWARVTPDGRNVFLAAQNQHEFESFKVESIDEYTGPQIRVCLWNAPGGSHLLIKVSHYVADASGVKDVSRLISTIYSRLSHEPDYRPSPNLKGSRGVRQVLRAVPWHRYPGLCLQSLRDARASQVPRGTLTLPFQQGPADSLSFINRLLPRDPVSRLTEYGRRHNATINDLLLAAFFRALAAIANWDGHTQLRVNSTVDLRRYMSGTQASAVANLSVGPEGWPSLGTDLGQDFSATLDKIVSITSPRKQKFVGIDTLVRGILLFGPLPHTWAAKSVERYFRSQVAKGNYASSLTNMGAIEPGIVTFATKPFAARLLPPPFYPPFFVLGVSGYDGTLALSTGVYASQKDLVERFLDAMVAELPS